MLLARSPAVSGNALAALSMVVWAFGFPALEVLLQTWSPAAVATGRFVLSLLLLVPVLLAMEGWPRGMPWGRALLYGAVGLGGGTFLMILAQAATDPVTVAVIASVTPLAATLVEWAEDRRPLSRGFLLGLGASVLGGVVATAGSRAEGGSLAVGVALAVGSCLVYSWGSHRTVRGLPGQSALAQSTATIAGGLLLAGAAFAGVAALGGPGLPPGAFSGRDLGLLAVYALGGMALSQLLFVLAIRRIGVALASFHVNGTPFYVMLIMLAFGGGWSWMQALGAAVVVGGVVLAQRA